MYNLDFTNDLFEGNGEIETLALILQEWKQEHPDDVKVSYAEFLIDKLDYLYRIW